LSTVLDTDVKTEKINEIDNFDWNNRRHRVAGSACYIIHR